MGKEGQAKERARRRKWHKKKEQQKENDGKEKCLSRLKDNDWEQIRKRKDEKLKKKKDQYGGNEST